MSDNLEDDALPSEAIDFCDLLIDDLEDLRILVEAGDLPRGARDFADGVEEKIEGIRDWIDSNSCVTERQVTALRNIREGVDRWFRD